jgi:hypothetical protein
MMIKDLCEIQLEAVSMIRLQYCAIDIEFRDEGAMLDSVCSCAEYGYIETVGCSREVVCVCVYIAFPIRFFLEKGEFRIAE